MKMLKYTKTISLVWGSVILLGLMNQGCLVSSSHDNPQASLSCQTTPSYVYPVYDYNYDEWRWYFDLSVSENNGVGVQLQTFSIAFYYLDGTFQYEQDYSGQISSWFGTSWIDPYGTIGHNGNFWTNTNGSGDGWQAVFYIGGVDDYGNSVNTSCGVTAYNS